MNPNRMLAGQRVVIVGGTSGIGLATAHLAIAQGAKVVVASRSAERLKAAKAELGPNAEALRLDATKAKNAAAFFKKVGKFHHLTVLVPAAGDPRVQRKIGPLARMDLSTAHQVMENKFWTSMICAQAALPYLARTGSITFCSGVSPRKALPGYWASTAAIAALEGVFRALAVEIAPIRVNCVGPGIIATPVLNAFAPQRLKAWNKLIKRQPVGRMGTADEVAQAMVYCMTNGFTTGALIEIDGGYKFT
ncbi:MAG: SDR family oxidoreductase [Alphaproteobacteria bacterium]